MGLAKSILLTALGVLLSLYSFDCGGMTTPDQAMECCKSMPCSTGGHQGQDCCKVMPAMHSPFVQTSVLHGLTYSPVVAVTFETIAESQGENSSARGIAENSHAPPIVCSSIPLPLRV
jgi:hypothetical protein